MKIEKLKVYLKLEEQGLKCTSEDFVPNMESYLKNCLAEVVDLKFVAPETFAKVSQVAKNFKSDLKKLWTKPKVLPTYLYYLQFLIIRMYIVCTYS